jgi:hypothetical protein
MSMSLLLQYAVIALAVLASAVFVVRKQFPNAVRKLRIACALPLLRDGRPDWLRACGRWIAPPAAPAGSRGCGGCDNCDTRP